MMLLPCHRHHHVLTSTATAQCHHHHHALTSAVNDDNTTAVLLCPHITVTGWTMLGHRHHHPDWDTAGWHDEDDSILFIFLYIQCSLNLLNLLILLFVCL